MPCEEKRASTSEGHHASEYSAARSDECELSSDGGTAVEEDEVHSVATSVDEREPFAANASFADEDTVPDGGDTDTEEMCQGQSVQEGISNATTLLTQLVLWATQAQVKLVRQRSLLCIHHPYKPELP